MRTRSFKSSGNSMSSSDEHREQAEKVIGHVTVLLHEAIEQLGIQSGDIVVDATLGGGGHAAAIAKMLGKKGMLIGMDLDHEAIERARTALKDSSKPKIHLVAGNFRNLSTELTTLDVKTIDKALFDLGWSGYQLAAGRGFSFLKDEPLVMTYSANPGPNALTASTIVNEWEEESIADVIFGWGEEHYSRRIAKAIVEARAKSPIRTSMQLAEIIRSAVPPQYRYGRIHPATRTFQALRIAVNDELGALREGLQAAWNLLSGPSPRRSGLLPREGGPSPRRSGLLPREGGRIAVITFHSIEDREVKRLFVKWEEEGEGKRITRSPIRASAEENKSNPRARSAKLRVIEKT